MNKGIIAFLVLVGLVAAGFLFAIQIERHREANSPKFEAISQPPDNATMLDPMLGPRDVAEFPGAIGTWIAHPEGWQGTATKVSLESEGVLVRMWMPLSGALSGGMWTLAYFEGLDSVTQLPFTEGQGIRFGGKIAGTDQIIDISTPDPRLGAISTTRLMVRPAYLIK